MAENDNTIENAGANSPGTPDELTALKEQVAKLEKLVGKQGKATNNPANIIPQEVLDNEKRTREKVRIKLFKDNGKYKDDVFVGVNGENYQIKRGVEVEVPRYVKEILDNSTKQDEDAAKYAEELADQYEQSSK